MVASYHRCGIRSVATAIVYWSAGSGLSQIDHHVEPAVSAFRSQRYKPLLFYKNGAEAQAVVWTTVER